MQMQQGMMRVPRQQNGVKLEVCTGPRYHVRPRSVSFGPLSRQQHSQRKCPRAITAMAATIEKATADSQVFKVPQAVAKVAVFSAARYVSTACWAPFCLPEH